jgi:hypothetical protein
VFKISRAKPYPPTLDLTTVRVTLGYMHDDMKRIAGLERLAASLETAIAEVSAAERQSKPAVLTGWTRPRFLTVRR